MGRVCVCHYLMFQGARAHRLGRERWTLRTVFVGVDHKDSTTPAGLGGLGPQGFVNGEGETWTTNELTENFSIGGRSAHSQK